MRRLAFVAGMLLWTLSRAGAAEADSRGVLSRLSCLTCSWGEVGLREGRDIRLDFRRGGEDSRTFPHGLALDFTTRTRSEPAVPLEDGPAGSKLDVGHYGTILLAGTFADSRAWDTLLESTLRNVTHLSPGNYAEFFETFLARAVSGSGVPGDFEIFVCLSRDDLGDRVLRGHQRNETREGETGDPMRSERGTDEKAEWRPLCQDLIEEMASLPVEQVLASAISLREAREETLEVLARDSRSHDSVPWPEGARFSRTEAPAGASAYSRTQTRDGESRHELLRPSRGSDEPGLLVMEAKPSILDSSILDGASVLLRWTRVRTDRKLGADPSGSPRRDHLLDWGIFLTRRSPALSVEALTAAVARDLDRAGSTWTPSEVEAAIRKNIFETGEEEVFSLICPPDPGAETPARYCLGQACALVLNGESICPALAARFR